MQQIIETTLSSEGGSAYAQASTEGPAPDAPYSSREYLI